MIARDGDFRDALLGFTGCRRRTARSGPLRPPLPPAARASLRWRRARLARELARFPAAATCTLSLGIRSSRYSPSASDSHLARPVFRAAQLIGIPAVAPSLCRARVDVWCLCLFASRLPITYESHTRASASSSSAVSGYQRRIGPISYARAERPLCLSASRNQIPGLNHH